MEFLHQFFWANALFHTIDSFIFVVLFYFICIYFALGKFRHPWEKSAVQRSLHLDNNGWELIFPSWKNFFAFKFVAFNRFKNEGKNIWWKTGKITHRIYPPCNLEPKKSTNACPMRPLVQKALGKNLKRTSCKEAKKNNGEMLNFLTPLPLIWTIWKGIAMIAYRQKRTTKILIMRSCLIWNDFKPKKTKPARNKENAGWPPWKRYGSCA